MKAPRFTVRTMLFVVAIAALLVCFPIELRRRADRYKRLADHHRQEWVKGLWAEFGEPHAKRDPRAPATGSKLGEENFEYHRDFEDLYRQAATRPWRRLPSLEEFRRQRAASSPPWAPARCLATIGEPNRR